MKKRLVTVISVRNKITVVYKLLKRKAQGTNTTLLKQRSERGQRPSSNAVCTRGSPAASLGVRAAAWPAFPGLPEFPTFPKLRGWDLLSPRELQRTELEDVAKKLLTHEAATEAFR